MAEYHVGCGAFGIYAGTLNPQKTMWKNKTKVTDEAIGAVVQYLKQEMIYDNIQSFQKEYTFVDGTVINLDVSIKQTREVEE